MKNLHHLLAAIRQTHRHLQHAATQTVNRSLTLRNWLTGYFIVAYEQGGKDRAAYGAGLLEKLSQNLDRQGYSPRQLRLCRQFHLAYPQIGQVMHNYLPVAAWQLVIEQSAAAGSQPFEIWQTAPAQAVSPQKLAEQLSYSHFVQLIRISNAAERVFYEQQCIEYGWSVRQLRRCINNRYFDRAGETARLTIMHPLPSMAFTPAPLPSAV